jgi:PII-like signaling protein
MDVAGATVYRGILGYGAKGHTHKSGRLPFSHDLPVMISVVDSEEKLAKAIERGRIDDAGRNHRPFGCGRGPPGSQPARRRSRRMRTVRRAKLLRVHFGESDRYNGKPLYEAIVHRCQELQIAGATVFRGLEGYGESAEIHRHRLIQEGPAGGRHDCGHGGKPGPADSRGRGAMMDTGMIATSEVDYMRIEKPPADGT